MTVLLPVLLNPPQKRKVRKNVATNGWASAARASGAVWGSGEKAGKVMSIGEALQKKVPVTGHLTPTMIKEWHGAKITERDSAQNTEKFQKASARFLAQMEALKERRAAQKTIKKVTAKTSGRPKVAKKKTSKKKTSRKVSRKKTTSKKRTTRKAPRRRTTKKKVSRRVSPRAGQKKTEWTRSYSKKEGRPRPQSWTTAARKSGAVWIASDPDCPAGKAGKVMTKNEALRKKIPVVGYLTRKMIKVWYDSGVTETMQKRKTKKFQEMEQEFKRLSKGLKMARKQRSSPWRGKRQTYQRGKKKGQVKPDYTTTRNEDGTYTIKFRKGRGPTTTLHFARGFRPTEKQIRELTEGGFAGPVKSAGGTVVKLNRTKRRRKKAGTRRRNPPRTKTGRFKKKVRKNKGRKKVKKNARKKSTRKKSTRTRRKAKTSMAVYNNRRKAKKNPVRRRRRRRRGYKRNPGLALPAPFQQLTNASFWYTAAHVAVGAGATGMVGGMAMNLPVVDRVKFMPGVPGAAARAVVHGATAALIGWGGGKVAKMVGPKAGKALEGFSRNLLIGGLAYTLTNFLFEAFPGLSEKMRVLPQITTPSMAGLGYQGGPDFRYGYGGMGDVIGPEQLVEGESQARELMSGVGDWMELSGLGASGGQPVPLEDLRGYGYPGQYGMGDWVELASQSNIVQQGFNPGTENF